jgi:endonuclease III
MNETAIRDRLVERGQMLFRAPRKPVEFARNSAADALLNDLEKYPHAYVLACVMDRRILAEKAWLIPHRISERLGGFSIEVLAGLSQEEVTDLISRPEPLHYMFNVMSVNFHLAVQRIASRYSGDAARIWKGKPSSAEVVYRFLEFDGVGPKIATMAANILVRSFKIQLSDFFSIDVSVDRHVRRVFARLGLCAPDATIEQVIYKARALHPTFPGIMDWPVWEIGRNWCKLAQPECKACYMAELCPTANKEKHA